MYKMDNYLEILGAKKLDWWYEKENSLTYFELNQCSCYFLYIIYEYLSFEAILLD